MQAAAYRHLMQRYGITSRELGRCIGDPMIGYRLGNWRRWNIPVQRAERLALIEMIQERREEKWRPARRARAEMKLSDHCARPAVRTIAAALDDAGEFMLADWLLMSKPACLPWIAAAVAVHASDAWVARHLGSHRRGQDRRQAEHGELVVGCGLQRRRVLLGSETESVGGLR